MVVASHLSRKASHSNWIADSWSVVLGDTGVRIFFVLSGFLITTIILTEQSETGRFQLGRFYVRRIFRIFPAFYCYLAALALAASQGWIQVWNGDILKAGLYLIDYCKWDSTSNFVRHIWSLSVEEQFYLLWPLVLVLSRKRARWLVAAGAVLLVPAWRLAVFEFFPTAAKTLDRRFDCVCDALAIGCLLALLWHSGWLERFEHAFRSPWMNLLPVAVLAASCGASHPHVYLGALNSLMNLGIAAYLYHCVRCAPAWLNWGPVRRLGMMSYSLYLWQQLFCPQQDSFNRLPAYLAILLTIAAAVTSYYLVERPMQSLGRKVATWVADHRLRRLRARYTTTPRFTSSTPHRIGVKR
jgi:peptidoglycan/LPS O-acetylase OafA/YrhL